MRKVKKGHVGPKSKWVIDPENGWYPWFWNFTVALSVVNGFTEPFEMAFATHPGLAPFNDVWAYLAITVLVIFAMDIVLKFNVLFYDLQAGQVDTLPEIRRKYFKRMFWVDLVSLVPFNEIILAAAGQTYATGNFVRAVSILKLIHLIRLYRLSELYATLEHTMVSSTLGEFMLLMFRNNTIVLYSISVAGCIFWWIAQLEGLQGNSWTGRSWADRLEGRGAFHDYVYSLYTSITIFSASGDGDFYVNSPAESVYIYFYLLFSIVILAYIMGTVSVSVIKSDKRAKVYRERMTMLEDYAKLHHIPEALSSAMKKNMELHFSTEQASDEQVLVFYPTAVRRWVLRSLYLDPVADCYMFRACDLHFLDALLTSARIELFMPKAQILVEGDLVNDLYVVVNGNVETSTTMGRALGAAAAAPVVTTHDAEEDEKESQAGSRGTSFSAGSSSMGSSSMGSSSMGGSSMGASSMGQSSAGDLSGYGSMTDSMAAERRSRTGARLLGVSCSFGEAEFIADLPSSESVSAVTVVRVLVISRVAYEGLQASFPQQARTMLESIEVHAEGVMLSELEHAANTRQLTDDQQRNLASQLVDRSPTNAMTDDMDDTTTERTQDLLTPAQQAAFRNVKVLQAVVRRFQYSDDQRKTNDLLCAASRGDVERVRQISDSGLSINVVDNDKRSALMLAACYGHMPVVELLLELGADYELRDCLGITAMYEACKVQHDDMVAKLYSFGARLNMEAATLASHLCTCVLRGDLVMLKRLLNAGAEPDAADYDGRIALHIAAAEGNVEAVNILLGFKANVYFQDNFGNTALDEARRVGATDVINVLQPLMGGVQESDAEGADWDGQTQDAFMHACMHGDVKRVQLTLSRTDPGPLRATGLLLASKHKDVVELLLADGGSEVLVQTTGVSALLIAATMNHSAVVESLMQLGVRLRSKTPSVRHFLAKGMCAAARAGDYEALRRLIAAGLSPDIAMADGTTPLHAAAESGNLETLRFLLEEGGASMLVQDDQQRTPLDQAKESGGGTEVVNISLSMVEYLEWMLARDLVHNGGIPLPSLDRQQLQQQQPVQFQQPQQLTSAAFGSMQIPPQLVSVAQPTSPLPQQQQQQQVARLSAASLRVRDTSDSTTVTLGNVSVRETASPTPGDGRWAPLSATTTPHQGPLPWRSHSGYARLPSPNPPGGAPSFCSSSLSQHDPRALLTVEAVRDLPGLTRTLSQAATPLGVPDSSQGTWSGTVAQEQVASLMPGEARGPLGPLVHRTSTPTSHSGRRSPPPSARRTSPPAGGSRSSSFADRSTPPSPQWGHVMEDAQLDRLSGAAGGSLSQRGSRATSPLAARRAMPAKHSPRSSFQGRATSPPPEAVHLPTLVPPASQPASLDLQLQQFPAAVALGDNGDGGRLGTLSGSLSGGVATALLPQLSLERLSVASPSLMASWGRSSFTRHSLRAAAAVPPPPPTPPK